MSSQLWDAVREGCGSCEFAGPPNPYKQHECRRKPPVMLVVHYPQNNGFDCVERHRPWMEQSDWCGEWKRKQECLTREA